MMRRLRLPLLLSMLLATAASCSSDRSDQPNCFNGKCDALDLPDSEVEASPCDGAIIDKSGRGLGNGKIAGRLNDPLSQLVFRSGDDCPASFEEIVAKLDAATEANGHSCDNKRTMAVSETAQALGRATNYRSVTALDCEQPDGDDPDLRFDSRTGIIFSLFGLQAGGGLPGNAEIIAFDKSTGVFNFYETEGDRINFFGNSKDMLRGTGSGGDRRCAACHTGGGLIMKELAAPWLHWEGDTDTPGAADLISAHQELLGDHSDGIDMEDLTRAGNRDWNQARIDHLRDLGESRELLRPLFCNVEVNIENATSSDNGTAEGVVSDFNLGGPVFNTRLGFGSLSSSEEQYDGLIRANGQQIPGLPAEHIETVFGLVTIVPSEADQNYISALINAGIIDEELAEDVLAVDFTRSVFSDDRCELLAAVPAKMDSSDLKPDSLRAAILEGLGSTASGTPENELKNNLANPNDDLRAAVRAFSDACNARAETVDLQFEKDGSSQTLAVPAVVQDYMKIVSLNRDQARNLTVFEFPQTMPDDDQNIEQGTRLHPVTCTITRDFVAVAAEFDPGATCFDRCGDEAPSGCSCDPSCKDSGTCCDDFSDQCEIPECAHGICSAGGALEARCQDLNLPGDCVAQICANDSFCCDSEWDDSCVQQVTGTCGLSCEADRGDGGTCCRVCGETSKPCGDACIPLDNTCNTPPGCACDSSGANG